MYQRNCVNDLRSALQDSPIVLINGARQVGKSTLAKEVLQQVYPGSPYYTLDDTTALAAIKSSPLSFLEALPSHAVIDEIQRVKRTLLSTR